MVNCAGIVLCGGRSSRMGRAKAWLPFGDEVLLQRVVRIVGEAVSPVVVVAAPGQDVPALPADVQLVRDDVEGRGPLQGLAAGLAALQGKADAAFVSACDSPFLTPAFVRCVVDVLANGRCEPAGGTSQGGQFAVAAGSTSRLTPAVRPSIAVPRVGGYLHPLATAYRLDVLPFIRKLLVAGGVSMRSLFDVVETRYLDAAELPDLDSLRNINTPEEYAAAYQQLFPERPCDK